MDFNEFLEKYEAQKKTDKSANRYTNRRIALYGAGQFAQTIFENYDLSKLNIVAVADKKFEDEEKRSFNNLNCIPPEALGDFDCDLILIANLDYNFFLSYLDNHILYRTKNAAIEVRPLIRLGFKDLFLRK